MKTNERANRILKLRHWVGLLAVVLLLSAEFCMVCVAGHGCGQFAGQPTLQAPSISDCFATR